ncbi:MULTISPECIES: AAA family ATPase [Paenarthrobacter]|uniref:AAA family ATPase n=1 Tax=Paenarthrobacter ureafaciens TaxID=37931 RepID=A0AAX3EQW3_PAEUR|nr:MULTISPECIES: AAA family ATPase [Paenarthrobacter]MDO5867123.1 AAA family ATPase [Paenarthrobacter sp. SD-2]MDO5878377.1 AAA family ATPase [Paenarthrobacter sp. SD-1]UYV95604.1 AAA family ATPase [Paenarthrobacter ureafaciens]UYW00247.1 AAA family ATPase [Paenarthrobacter ureafaciens]
MTNQKETAPGWRELSVAKNGLVSIDRQTLEDPGTDPFTTALGILAAAAKESGEETLVHSTDENTGTSSWFTVDQEGMMTVAGAPAQTAPAPAKTGSHAVIVPADIPAEKQEQLQEAFDSIDDLPPLATPPVLTKSEKPAGFDLPATPAAGAAAPAPGSRREARRSFLTQEQVEEPAKQGWRGFLTSMGIRMTPGQEERAERADIQMVSQHWPGPRTIAVVNGRGGVGKSMTTIGLSATFARYGGSGVLAEDNNQTRGTLGWRTEKGPHDASLLDLLPQIDRLLAPSAQAADLAHYVHHQTRDKYDVLRSRPELLASDQRFDAETVDAVHAVATKYYRLILIDSGNDESDAMWLRMIHHADQIVVPTTTRRDSAESAALLLDALHERGGNFAKLAENAVVVVSQENPAVKPAVVAEIAAGFKTLAREVVTVPFDPAMKDGLLTYGSLRPATQRAWLAAGAAVAKGL